MSVTGTSLAYQAHCFQNDSGYDTPENIARTSVAIYIICVLNISK